MPPRSSALKHSLPLNACLCYTQLLHCSEPLVSTAETGTLQALVWSIGMIVVARCGPAYCAGFIAVRLPGCTVLDKPAWYSSTC